MKKFKEFTLKKDGGCFPCTREQAFSLMTLKQFTDGEVHYQIETVGPWGICKSITSPATVSKWEDGPGLGKVETEITFIGFRKMSNPESLGYEMEGNVSYEDKKVRAFTSSKLLEVDGHLINVGILHVCVGQVFKKGRR